MISDRLYELAFLYKKTKVWEQVSDTQIFAIKLSDGKLGYVSIMGFSGNYYALALYIEDSGFQSLYNSIMVDRHKLTQLQFREYLLQQNCLQCVWETKDATPPEEREEVKAYARANGIRIAGKNPYPRFLKYQPNHLPWELRAEEDQSYLCEALEASIALGKLLDGTSSWEAGIHRIENEPDSMVVVEAGDDGYRLGKMAFPKIKKTRFPEPKAVNDISIAKMKKAERTGVWECEIILFPEPVQDNPDEVPFFPVVMMAVESATNFILPISPVEDYTENAEKLLDVFIEAFLKQDLCPLEMKARDERTYAFLKSFCKRLKIKLTIEEELPALEEAEFDFMERFGKSEDEQMEDIIAVLEELLKLSEEEIQQMPDEIEHVINLLMEQDILPEEIKEKIKKVFHAKKPKKKKSKEKVTKLVPEQSYVISVSVCTGCYRHIRISGKNTLFDLHSAILKAFKFDDEHAHAFFMDNVKWSEEDCYYMSGIENYYRSTDRFRLNQIGFYKGMPFKYIFDFGDEWLFQCKILRILDEPTQEPVVVRSKGKAPEQYEWYMEWDDDDDDGDKDE
jgi:hypothetical protein